MPDEYDNSKNHASGDKGFLRHAWSELKEYKTKNPLGVSILVVWSIAVCGFWRWGNFMEKSTPFYLIGGALAVTAAFLRAKAMDESVKIQSRGQVHERFNNAVGLLSGASGDIVKCLAGIYALNHIAREWQEEYRRPVFEILCGYLRTNDHKEGITESGQAILNLLFDKNSIYQGLPADLKGTDLRYAILVGSHMREANLTKAQMLNANLREADLRKSDFSKIEGGSTVDFTSANLRDGKFCHARLVGVNFIKVKLHGANFDYAYLETVDFTGAEGMVSKMFFNVEKWKNVKGVSRDVEEAVREENPRAFKDE